MQFALVAEKRDDDDDAFYGVWTYDESLVARALELLPTDRTGEGDEGDDAGRDTSD